MAVELFFDGGCYGNPNGVATYGYVVYRDGMEVRKEQGVVGEGEGMTNNVAEYEALLKGLQWIKAQGWREPVTVRGDSELIIRQLAGKYKIRSATAKKYFPLVKGAAEGMNIRYRHVPREENTIADALTKQAYEEHRKQQRR